ncbi:MAG: hypothetical protein IKP72_00365 [Clostridia bacterium]|nr:hypothetical protein [Clostridia bacterium]
MSKTKKQPLRSKEDDPLFDIQQAASMTECTGILSAQIGTEDEAENIAALQSVHPVRPSALIREKKR